MSSGFQGFTVGHWSNGIAADANQTTSLTLDEEQCAIYLVIMWNKIPNVSKVYFLYDQIMVEVKIKYVSERDRCIITS